jgi:hypothetical protein
MTAPWSVAAILVLTIASLTAASPPSPPPCVQSLIAGESGARAHIPAPAIAPARGRPGTAVTITGSGFPPGSRVIIAGVYAERGCSIEGLGDQFLGSVGVNGRGAYSLTAAWPALFDPVLGRNQSATKPLPDGRYYLFALPCSERATCSFTTGTLPGGPFVLGPSRGARAGPIACVVAGFVLVLGLVGFRAKIARRSR